MGVSLTKLCRTAIASLMFLALVLAAYVVHMRWFPVDVVLYSSLFDVALATAVAAGLLVGLTFFRVFSGFEKFQMTVIWILLGYAIAISGPTIIDRSLSFYILEKLDQRGGGIQLDRFEEVLTKEFLKEYRVVDARLAEQTASGTVVVVDGCVRLTPRGGLIASISRWFRHTLMPRHRLLRGEYSDDLVDPFRRSATDIDYRC
jgi:hypothetical protein